MKRRFLAVGMALSLILSMAGCKKGGETEPAEATFESTATANDIASNAETDTKNNAPAQTAIVDMNDSTPGDYGKIYYAPVDEAHVAGDEMSKYIDNEVLIVVKDGTTEDQVSKLAEKYNAKIVGAIEVSGDYQLRLNEAETKETLESKIKDIETEDIVVRASLNYVAELSETDTEGHAGFKFGEKWKEDLQNYTDVKGKSWGIEAINVMGAWDKLQKNKDRVKPVNLGLIDCGFEVDHEDLKGIYAEVFYDGKTNGVVAADRGHGTHVSGTMAANCDNLIGICGVYPYGKGRLYGVSLGGEQKWGGVNAYAENKGYLDSIMSQKIAYAELIVRNVKVINQSQGFNWYANKYLKKDDQGNEYIDYDKVKKWWDDPLNFFDQTRNVTELADFFKRMLDKGYDFVIVTGAGNDSHPSIGHLDARYASWITLIPRMVYTEVYDRIIVVGSVNEELQVSWFTNGGSRVDIYAPGENIYSTYPTNDYVLSSGTSMAAPHVAGIAAMVWSANNSLNGKQVKKAITENFSKDCSSCHMVDAQRAVEYALTENDTGKNTNAESGGVLCFVVEEGNETNRIPNAKVTLVNADTLELYETVTDLEGHFEIMVPEGRYSLFVSAQGYEDYQWLEFGESMKFIEVRNEQINYLDRDIGDWIKLKRVGSTVNASDPTAENGEQPTKVNPFGPGTGTTEETKEATSSNPLARESNGYIIFGHYEQDNNIENGKEPIEWDILDENANGKLLISRYVLDAVPFNNEYAEVTWETCSLREWLNKDFLNEAFTKGEQAQIPKVRLENRGVDMSGGNATEDQVFCLSMEEAAKYYKLKYSETVPFNFVKELIILPTEYAKGRGLVVFNAKDCIDEPYGDEYWLDAYAPKGYQASIADLAGTYWWLRTMDDYYDVLAPCSVFPNGCAGQHFDTGVSDTFGVRPVLWISNEAFGGESNPPKGNEKEPTSDLNGYKNKDGYVVFGHYEQDNNTANGKEPIEWKVLAADEDGLFVLSKDVLDAHWFNDRAQNITWANSSLRNWLNDEFYRDAFTSDEKKGIRTTKVKTPANPKDGTAGGADVEDRVFLLSIDEAIKYLPSEQERIAEATEYADKNSLYMIESYGNSSQWWLRSSATPGTDTISCAAMVFYDGEIHDEYVYEWTLGVRPAMWIRKDAIKGTGETETKPVSPEPYDGDGVAINAENFPDERFRMLLQDDYDEDGNWVFSKEEIEEIKRVDVFEENISSLQGIELLYNLQRLQCGKNKLTSLDVSHNTKLKYLACSNNPLSGLDVSHNTALEELYYSETGLKEVDISNNTNLKVLYCSDNDMTRLDVSHNPALEALGCKGNQLTSLDLSKNTKLEKLYCSSNLLTELDLSHNPDLKQLHCQVNELQTLDVSRHPLLVGLECFYNQLTELDVSHNPMLTSIDCGDNQLKSLDVSHNPALTSLTCGGNQLVSLDVSRNEELKRLTCAANHISNLDLSNNKQLTYLRIDKKTGFTGLVPGVDVELVDGGKFTHMTSE